MRVLKRSRKTELERIVKSTEISVVCGTASCCTTDRQRFQKAAQNSAHRSETSFPKITFQSRFRSRFRSGASFAEMLHGVQTCLTCCHADMLACRQGSRAGTGAGSRVLAYTAALFAQMGHRCYSHKFPCCDVAWQVEKPHILEQHCLAKTQHLLATCW